MKPILVSIIIPCYNVEEYVAEALESAIGQTYRPIEIIAVDNNSTDRTITILREYERMYPALVTVLEEKKQGAPAARNKGMSVAKGEWLQFLDADDILLAQKIEKQITLAKVNPNAHIVIGTYLYRFLNGREIVFSPNEGNVLEAVLKSELGYTVSNLFRRTDRSSQPIWNNNLQGAQDMNFIFDYIIRFGHQLVYDRSPYTVTRERPYGQISKSSPILYYNSCIEFQLHALEVLKTSFSDFFRKNQFVFYDNLYYLIYCAALVNEEFDTQLLNKLLPNFYKPKFKKNNKISLVHFCGTQILGFSNYVKLRRLFL